MINPEILSDVKFFSGFSSKEIKDISDMSEYLELPKGDILFSEGDHCRDIYLLLEGRFDVSVKMLVKTTSDYDNILTTIKSGEVIGELSFIDGTERSATVIVRNNARVIKIPYEAIKDYFSKHTDTGYMFLEKISTILTRRVRDINLLWRNEHIC